MLNDPDFMQFNLQKIANAARSFLDPGNYFHLLRLIHYYSYSHVKERRKLNIGSGTTISPNVSLRNGGRITIGDNCHLGENCYIWAGDTSGRILIGNYVVIAPDVFITASNYKMDNNKLIGDQLKVERDIHIGDNVWLGARVVVTAGVTIGSGCIVGAGAVVTSDLPSDSLAGGVPARIIRSLVSDDIAAG